MKDIKINYNGTDSSVNIENIEGGLSKNTGVSVNYNYVFDDPTPNQSLPEQTTPSINYHPGYKIPRDYYKGTSFHWSGEWTTGIHYNNDEFVVDFITHYGALLVCQKSHVSSKENEPIIFVDKNGNETNNPSEMTGVISEYWDFVCAGGESGKTPGIRINSETLHWETCQDIENPEWIDTGVKSKFEFSDLTEEEKEELAQPAIDYVEQLPASSITQSEIDAWNDVADINGHDITNLVNEYLEDEEAVLIDRVEYANTANTADVAYQADNDGDGNNIVNTYKVKQTAKSSPSASGSTTAFIDTISQDAEGVITATKKNIDFSSLDGTITKTAGSASASTAAASYQKVPVVSGFVLKEVDGKLVETNASSGPSTVSTVDVDVAGSAQKALNDAKSYANDLIAGLGPIMHFEGTVATEAALKALTNKKKGDVYVVTADSSEWVCKKDITTADPTAWEKFGTTDVQGALYKNTTGEFASGGLVYANGTNGATNTIGEYNSSLGVLDLANLTRVEVDNLSVQGDEGISGNLTVEGTSDFWDSVKIGHDGYDSVLQVNKIQSLEGDDTSFPVITVSPVDENGRIEIGDAAESFATRIYGAPTVYTGLGNEGHILHTAEQSLTAAEKQQARQNIDIDGTLSSEPLAPIDDPTNAYYTKTQTDTLLSGKQPTLVSGTNIKTVNNNSLLGSGNITIDPNNTFIARYNVTSFADVKAAYLAGKNVLCLRYDSSSSDADIYLSLYEYYTGDGPGYESFLFTGIRENDSYAVYLNENGDSWSTDNSSLAFQNDLNNRVPYYNTSNKSVRLYGGYPVGNGSLTLYGGRASSTGSLTMGYAYNNTNTTNNSIQANGTGSFAGGYSGQNSGIVASGYGSIAFGSNGKVSTKIQATGDGATAIGVTSIIIDGVTYMGKLSATGPGAHAEGCASQAAGPASHTEGIRTSIDVNALAAHAEGYLSGANSNYSHAEGNHTVTTNESEHAEGKYNQSNTNTISSIGIGTADDDRKNAFEVMSTGDMYIKGVGTYDGTNPISGTNDVKSIIDSKAPLASPALTGTPTAPTAASGTNTTQIATTAFVQSAISGGTANFVPYADTNNNSVTIGTRSGTIAQRSLTVGYNNTASSTDTLAIGYATKATGQGSFAGGYTTVSNGIQATGTGSFAFGYNAKSGKQIKASGTGSIAIGSTALDTVEATGNYSIAIGSNNHATNAHTYAIGWGNTASTSGAVAIGCGATASGENAISISGYATAIGSKSIGGRATGQFAISIGNGVWATKDNSVAIGRFNRYDSNTQFSIGNGTADNARSNLLEIYSDKFYVNGIGTYDGTNPTSGTNDVGSIINSKAPLSSPAFTGTPTAPTAAAGTNTTQVATTAFVKTAIDELPEPMIFKGSLGTGGTITTLPAASSSNEGWTYKVITAGTYAGQAAKVGDTFISTGTEWVLIPSGDEPSGTVISVGAGTGLSISGNASVNPTVNVASGYKLPTATEWNVAATKEVFIIIPGTTTWQEAYNAYSAGKLVYYQYTLCEYISIDGENNIEEACFSGIISDGEQVVVYHFDNKEISSVISYQSPSHVYDINPEQVITYKQSTNELPKYEASQAEIDALFSGGGGGGSS